MKMNPYLNYGGNCEQALRSYEKHLGGKILMMSTFSDMPSTGIQVPKGMENKVLHARIEIGGMILMASDTPQDRFQPMRSAYLSLFGGKRGRGRANLCFAQRWRRDFHAHGRDVFR